MGFWNRKSVPADRVTAEVLATYGRHEFLREQSGLDPSVVFEMITPLNELIYTRLPSDRATLVAELTRHAEKGEWEKVGAWKYVRDFLDDADDTRHLIDGGLYAVDRMGVTNLAMCLSFQDRSRYEELFERQPPDDGFSGPPVFTSDYGPTRQYYFDHAIATAAGRWITRLVSRPGVEPGPLDEAVVQTWSFALLILRGPMLVSSDITFEPNVVRPLVAAATDVDHVLFAERLAEAVATKEAADVYGNLPLPWYALGATRFIEDYLALEATNTDAYRRLVDRGVALAVQGGVLGRMFSAEMLSLAQRERLSAHQAVR
jgi:hypothetical protein